MKTLHTVKLKACKKENIYESKMFNYLDSNFKNWNLEEKYDANPKTLEVLEMDKNGTFKDIFSDPDKMCLTQGQILSFVKNHKDKLRTGGYATFFLFKVGNEFFVARVRLSSGGDLSAYVYLFSRDYVWYAGDRHRIVVPQLTLKTSESSPSDTLSLEARLTKIENWIKKEANFINPFD